MAAAADCYLDATFVYGAEQQRFAVGEQVRELTLVVVSDGQHANLPGGIDLVGLRTEAVGVGVQAGEDRKVSAAVSRRLMRKYSQPACKRLYFKH